MKGDAPVIDAPGRRTEVVLDQLLDEDVVSLEPPLREALARVAPEPTARWRILAYKWFVLLHRTD